MAVTVGSLRLPNPVMTASGTAGHGAELSGYFPLDRLGAVVVKSLCATPWLGNPSPRLHRTPSGMLNSVGLQGPGVSAWRESELPALVASGARIVASIWGRSVDEYRQAAALLTGLPSAVIAVEVNLSCPNLDGGRHQFAQSPTATAEAVRAVGSSGLPVWAKLTPNVTDVAEIAVAAAEAGADAVTLINTVTAMAIDPETRRYRLGAGASGGGLSGPAIHPIAVRAVHDVHAALPQLPIVGVGGVTGAEDAAELMMAGASAVQVGTATFADPRAPMNVLEDLERWCAARGVARVAELRGAAHG